GLEERAVILIKEREGERGALGLRRGHAVGTSGGGKSRGMAIPRLCRGGLGRDRGAGQRKHGGKSRRGTEIHGRTLRSRPRAAVRSAKGGLKSTVKPPSWAASTSAADASSTSRPKRSRSRADSRVSVRRTPSSVA